MICKTLFRLYIFLGCIFCAAEALASLIDLETGVQDFVLFTKQIEVPGYPDAYNPSIIRWNEKLLLSFRLTPGLKKKYDSDIGVVWLDEEFNAISEPQILDLCSQYDSRSVPSRAEDGRLVAVGKTLYLVYDDNRNPTLSGGGFRVRVAELDVDGEKVAPKNIDILVDFEGQKPTLREKGWTPFDYNNELMLAYSISPHRIFRYVPNTGSCATISETDPAVYWKWGVLRGGTAAAKIDDAFYLSFFHSSIKMTTIHSGKTEALHYFMGAYIYSLVPPFQILGISPEPIIGKNFYHGKTYKPYHHPICAIFPAGYVCDGNNIFVVYGRQDHEVWVVALDKAGLLNSLKPVFFE